MTNAPVYGARLPLAVGFTAIALLIGVVGAWSVGTRIAGAVIAHGTVVVENNRQVVQHAEGGTVGAILARDGQRVAAGELLLRLDGTLLSTELAVAELRILELRARRARLEAERDGSDRLTVPPDLAAAADGDAARQIEGQRSLFDARRETLAKEVSQIAEQIRQTRNQIAGTRAQLGAVTLQNALVEAELADQETLLRKGLVQAGKVSQLRREAARLTGDLGQLTAEVAQLEGRIAALALEKLRRIGARREAAIAELRDVRVRELELAEERARLAERLRRLDIRAPAAGVVYGSTVFAEQAVVRPAEPLMYVVPEDRPLIVGARVDAVHIDQVFVGQEAALRFTAFDQRRTPEVEGTVIAISADAIADEVSGAGFYRVDLAPRSPVPDRAGARKLMPGMPVEVFLRTGDRTPLSYLVKPLTDYFGRALREG